MRLGITLRPGHEAADAAAAEQHGCFGVLVDAPAGTECIAAAAAAGTTSLVRIVVRLHLGDVHPVTLAEEVAVLDNLARGRVVVLADLGDLDAAAAAEDLALLAAGLSARPIRHRGARWQVPAGLAMHQAPEAIQVTPEPVQVLVPVWLMGAAAAVVAARPEHAHLPVVATDPDAASAAVPVQPGAADLPAGIDPGRALVSAWARAGATHLLLRTDDPAAALPGIARHLAPEVAMPHFPRVVAEAMTPAPWPRGADAT